MSKTIEEYMQKKRETLGNMRAFSRHKHLTAKIAPRCLRVVERFKKDDSTNMPLGWCNISIVE